MKKIIYSIGIITFLGVILGFIFYQNTSHDFDWGDTSQVDNTRIVYIKNDCELCKVVEEYVEDKGLSQERVQVKDIDKDQNFQDFQDVAGRCDLLPRSVEVPFLWDGENERCYRQAPDIITFLEEEVE